MTRARGRARAAFEIPAPATSTPRPPVVLVCFAQGNGLARAPRSIPVHTKQHESLEVRGAVGQRRRGDLRRRRHAPPPPPLQADATSARANQPLSTTRDVRQRRRRACETFGHPCNFPKVRWVPTNFPKVPRVQIAAFLAGAGWPTDPPFMRRCTVAQALLGFCAMGVHADVDTPGFEASEKLLITLAAAGGGTRPFFTGPHTAHRRGAEQALRGVTPPLTAAALAATIRCNEEAIRIQLEVRARLSRL